MDDKKLISLVKKHKNLYEKRSKDYGNKSKRVKAWSNISFVMKCDEGSCQSRWKNIRDRYVRLFQKKKLTGKERRWNLLERLRFLNKHIHTRRTETRDVAISTSIETEQLSEEVWDPLDPQKLLENSHTKEDQFQSTSQKRKRGGEESGPMNQHDEIKEEFDKYSRSRQVHEEMVEEDDEELDEEKLINEVKKFKNLYERGNKDYRNKVERSKSWKEISIALNFDEAACRSRWKNIRDHYVKMCQRSQASGKQNSANENHWHLFEFMGFLNNYIKHRITTNRGMPNSTSAEEEEELFEEVLYPVLDDSQELKNVHTKAAEVSSSGRKRRSRKKSKETCNTKQLDETQELRKYEWSQVPGLSPSKHIPFLQMMVQKLEDLPEDHQDEIKLNVITYVYDYYKEFKNSKNTNDSSL